MSTDPVDQLADIYEDMVLDRAIELERKGPYMGGAVINVLPEFFEVGTNNDGRRTEDALLRVAPHRVVSRRVVAMGRFTSKLNMLPEFEDGALPEGTMVNLSPHACYGEDSRRVAGAIAFPIVHNVKDAWLTFVGKYVVEQPSERGLERRVARISRLGLPERPFALPAAFIVAKLSQVIAGSGMESLQPLVDSEGNVRTEMGWREAPSSLNGLTIANAIIAATDSFQYVNLDF